MTLDRDQLRADLIRDEGLRLSPYRCTADKLTIGVGHNLDANPISERAAMVILDDDIAACEAGLDRYWPWWRGLPEPQQRAMVNMAFQLGIGGLGKFKRMLAALQARQFELAAGEALNSEWAKQTPARAKRVAELMGAK